MLGALRSFVGLGFRRSGHLEKTVSALGGLAGILGVMLVSQTTLGLSGSASLVASMGASAVLLFAVPHGALSQPWAVFGGHLISAIIGVACAKLIAQPILSASLAVSLAIGAMYYMRCIHPPGGATALTAVAGSDALHALGFNYVLTPVLLNVLVILFVAVLFNFPFAWRRYPAVWARSHQKPDPPAAEEPPPEVFSRADLAAAGAVDPQLKDLDAICNLAKCNLETIAMDPGDIRIGAYYCNGEFGSGWQVRQVIDAVPPDTDGPTEEEALSYRVVAGTGRRRTDATTREAFADWARYEVTRNESSWQPAGATPCLMAISVDTPEPIITGDSREQSKST